MKVKWWQIPLFMAATLLFVLSCGSDDKPFDNPISLADGAGSGDGSGDPAGNELAGTTSAPPQWQGVWGGTLTATIPGTVGKRSDIEPQQVFLDVRFVICEDGAETRLLGIQSRWLFDGDQAGYQGSAVITDIDPVMALANTPAGREIARGIMDNCPPELLCNMQAMVRGGNTAITVTLETFNREECFVEPGDDSDGPRQTYLPMIFRGEARRFRGPPRDCDPVIDNIDVGDDDDDAVGDDDDDNDDNGDDDDDAVGDDDDDNGPPTHGEDNTHDEDDTRDDDSGDDDDDDDND